MSNYNMPPLGLFGKRCKILHGYNKEPFVYRIVNSGVQSNFWCEPPLTYQSVSNPILHKEMEDILIVVCDTLIDDKSKLIRVALKDIEIMDEDKPQDRIEKEYLYESLCEDLKNAYSEIERLTADKPQGEWIGIDEEPHEDYECSLCGYVCSMWTANIEPREKYKFCPNCGAKMGKEQK